MSAIAHRQRGATLVEALVAFLVLSLGIVVVSRVHGHLRLHADIARQRAEAVRFASQDIEAFRSFATLGTVAGYRSFAALSPTTKAIAPPPGDPTTTVYTLARSVDDAGGFKSARVAVQWTDLAGQAQHATLDTVVAGTDPALAASLTVPHPALRGARGRAPAIPPGAHALGDGRSVFKPAHDGTVAWVFDDLSGALESVCTVPAALSAAQLRAADLSACEASTGVVLAGAVRFAPGIAPLPLTVELTLGAGRYPAPPVCVAALHKTVAVTAAGGSRLHEVAAEATPATLGVPAWRDTGERYVAYHCRITPDGGRWSGRSHVVAMGWTLGHGASDHRVCRGTAAARWTPMPSIPTATTTFQAI